MEIITKIAYVALGLDILIILAGISVLAYLFSYWNICETLEHKIKNKIETDNSEEVSTKCQELTTSKKKFEQYYGYNGLASQNLKKKELDKAEEAALKAIEILPGESAAYVTLIDILMFKKETSRAFYYVFEAIEKTFLSFQLCMSAGKLFIFNNNYDEAIKMFELATNKDSSSPMPAISIAIVHYLNRNNTKAIDFVRTARKKINPNDTSHAQINEWANGLLAIMSGDLKEAKYIFEYYSEVSSFGPIFELILDRIKQVFKTD